MSTSTVSERLAQLLAAEEAFDQRWQQRSLVQFVEQPVKHLSILILARAVKQLEERLDELTHGPKPLSDLTEENHQTLAALWQPALDKFGGRNSIRYISNGMFRPKPHATVRRFVQLLMSLPAHRVEPHSIAVQEMVNLIGKATQAVRQRAVIIDSTMKVVDTIVVEGEKYFAFQATETGVEWIGNNLLEYRITSEEKIAAVKATAQEHTDKIAHCKKLINVELPAALEASKKRTAELMEADSAETELSEIGATMLEQKRITKEIADCKVHLFELEASPVPTLSKEHYALVRIPQRLVTPFGRQLIDGRVFEIMRASDSKPIAPQCGHETAEWLRSMNCCKQGSLDDPRLVTGHGQTLQVGDQCDCLDTGDQWCLAEIIDADAMRVRVHYVDWDAKWDEWIAREAKRLQPPLTTTN